MPRQWKEGLIVNLFKKGYREQPGNYRGITLLSVVGKVFCKILNNRMVQHLDKGGVLHEGQAGFRMNRSCTDNIYTLNEIVQGRLRERKQFFLDVQKAYDTVWRDGLWVKMWDMGVRGKLWRVIRRMYDVSRSAVLQTPTKSSAKSNPPTFLPLLSCIPRLAFSTSFNKSFIKIENNIDNLQPCATPCSTLRKPTSFLLTTRPRAYRVLLILYMGTVVGGDLGLM